ncbi:MAG: hypothetical protein CO032_01380 [Nitrosopumilales archaeon CG_4_9_14_0_2_um_filter_34_16]|nr:MAG: hypothetical protein CO032_01380 [Nitrosopumilales archaeon CG_4_9_14_0_2_um_filter_34_16]
MAVCLGLSSLNLSVYADTSVFYESGNHYSFNLPYGWQEIPIPVIEEYRTALSEELGMEEVPEYSGGFYLITNDYFEYPYILIQEFDRDYISFEEFRDLYKSQGYRLEDVEVLKELESKQLFSNIEIGEALFDNEKYEVFATFEMDTPGGTMKALGSIFFGREMITHVFFYSAKEDYEKYLPIFQTVIASFSYDSGYEYQTDKHSSESDKSELDVIYKRQWWESDWFYDFIVAGSAGLIIVLLLGIMNFLKKKK